MTKLTLIKKPEISGTEEKRGKQIAVKEANIVSLTSFYQNNIENQTKETSSPIPNAEITPTMNEEISVEQPVLTNTIDVSKPSESIENNFIDPVQINPTEINIPTIENKVEQKDEMNNPSDLRENEEGTEETANINLVPESPVLETEEEMDPELKEIKERLDKVIKDLNNYKKKIKRLEDEVNQNLEKSREVLKDTQAAAKIMSIQQERQRQITEEVAGGTTVENDASRILQKAA